MEGPLRGKPIRPPRLPLGYGGGPMLWTLFALLLVLWALGWGFHMFGSFIHLLLALALIVAVIRLLVPGRSAV